MFSPNLKTIDRTIDGIGYGATKAALLVEICATIEKQMAGKWHAT
jgi:endonuclease III